MSTVRVFQLDTLRGVASFLVVVHHALLAVSPDADLANVWLPLGWLPIGRPCVILFFVLSGFVLTLSLGDQSFPAFAARRFVRLYIPFAASILFALLLYSVVDHSAVVGQSSWFNDAWSNNITLRMLSGHFLMLGRWSDASLNNVVWSLCYEMRISFLLPLMVFVSRWRYAPWGFLLLAALTYCLSPPHPYYSYGFVSGALVTAYFIPMFAAGMYLALRKPSLPVSQLAWAPAVLLMCVPNDMVVCAGAVLTVYLALQSSWLNQTLLQWLGRVSFSLYLVHLPIIIAGIHVAHGILPDWASVLIAIPCSLLFAEVFYRYVEYPAMRLSRQLSWLEISSAMGNRAARKELVGKHPVAKTEFK